MLTELRTLQPGLGPHHETGLQTFYKPCSLNRFWWVSEFTSPAFPRWMDNKPRSALEDFRVFTLGVILSHYLPGKKNGSSVWAEKVCWGRLLCGERNTKYRPNICRSLSVKAACPLIDGADLRHWYFHPKVCGQERSAAATNQSLPRICFIQI